MIKLEKPVRVYTAIYFSHQLTVSYVDYAYEDEYSLIAINKKTQSQERFPKSSLQDENRPCATTKQDAVLKLYNYQLKKSGACNLDGLRKQIKKLGLNV